MATNDANHSSQSRDRRAARLARLKYVTGNEPGIVRRKRGRGFQYLTAQRRIVRDRRILERIAALAIPPAWQDVWICRHANGHLQATGRDARGRKQYRYHDQWRASRDAAKYQKLIQFARALPAIRRRVAVHLRLTGLPKLKVLAMVLKLLETTLIRVGNDDYAKNNDSFGLTTLRDQHVEIHGARMRFDFRGKGGVPHEIDACNPRLAALVRKCQDLPGRELFQYVDESGQLHDITSSDVNDYLREISGGDFTAKDFRTWAGTVLAAQALKKFEQVDTKTAARRNIRQAIERVAERLGNTAAVCRKCYIHPAILEAYLDRGLRETLKTQTARELQSALHRLPAEEGAVLVLLQQHFRRRSRQSSKRARVLHH